MRRRWLATVLALALALAGSGTAAARELVVCPGCPLPGLAAAVRQAAPGDRIRIRAGVYREGAIVINKPVEIVGEGEPVIDAGGATEGLVVRADDVVIQGLVVRNTGASFTRDVAGIRVEKAQHCRLQGNRLLDTFFGIYLAGASGCAVAGNEVRAHAVTETGSANAIHVWNCRDVVVRGNRISGHRDGIYLEFVHDSSIDDNLSEGNLRYGLHFMFSMGNRYRGNVFRDNGAGVAVMYSRDVTMERNRFEHNWGPAAYGLLLKEISDSRIADNEFVRNTTGLYAEGSSRLRVQDNDFFRNGWAIRVMGDTTGIAFTGNRLVGNTFDVTTNSSRSENAVVGNYWSDYRGYDLNRDGVGDVPHRPVRLFPLLAEQYPQVMILLRSPLLELLDLAERVIPVFTPQVLADPRPLVRSPR